MIFQAYSVYDKGKPVAKQGRKAMNLSSICEIVMVAEGDPIPSPADKSDAPKHSLLVALRFPPFYKQSSSVF